MSRQLLKQKIEEKHGGDEEQLSVIFSPTNRLIVEAPAGCGKTDTLVSKIAYLLATQQVPYPKKLLTLTFSVNAAYKVRKEVMQQVPQLLGSSGIDVRIREKIHVTNYHGLCRSILKKYGRLLHPNLSQLDQFATIDDGNVQQIHWRLPRMSGASTNILTNFSRAVRERNPNHLKEMLNAYCDAICDSVVPNDCITYNGILALTIRLFSLRPQIKNFYLNYFRSILVDEFQDTNWLSFWLLTVFVGAKTDLLLLGDSLQRIYGFIGAVPEAMSKAEKRFEMERIELTTNYRFASNEKLLLLDRNIRRNAESPSSPRIDSDAMIQLTLALDQSEESLFVRNKVDSLLRDDPTLKIAILVRRHGANVEKVIETFQLMETPFFYGLYSDDDPEYVRFHLICLVTLVEMLKDGSRWNRSLCRDHLLEIEKQHSGSTSPILASCLLLLRAFWDRMFSDYRFLTEEEKIAFVKDVFSSNGLKQYIEFVGMNVVISTVHAAKGLEWDIVILPDMEQDSFPNWPGLCSSCAHRRDCRLKIVSRNEEEFLDELSVFYVAATRARKDIYFTASRKTLNQAGQEYEKNLSCLLQLPGLRLS